MNKKRLTFRFEAKSLTDAGTFDGDLSVYDIVDLGGDSVQAGAFSKSLKENGGRVPLLWQHDPAQPIGWLDLEDSAKSLKARGTLLIDDVPKAREAYGLLKAGVLKGLSIGYETVKDVAEKGVRRLLEVKLWEGSVVTFPMLPAAMVSSVKAVEHKGEFAEELALIQAYDGLSQCMQALWNSLYDIRWGDEDGDTFPDPLTASGDAIDEFKAAYVAALQAYMGASDGAMKFAPFATLERKAGRRLSESSRARVAAALESLSTLLAEADEAESEAVKSLDKPSEPTLIEQKLLSLKSLMEVQ